MLKKLKQFPFDAYLNELNFNENTTTSFKNVIIPRSFSSDESEFSITLVRTEHQLSIQIDTPKDKDIAQFGNLINTYLNKLNK